LIPISARSLLLDSTFKGVGRFSPKLKQLTPLSRLTPVTSISAYGISCELSGICSHMLMSRVPEFAEFGICPQGLISRVPERTGILPSLAGADCEGRRIDFYCDE
jgi:hypothetical protein